MTKEILIIGCGQVGKKLAIALGKECRITCSVRSATSLDECIALGLAAIRCDLDQPEPPALPTANTTVYYLAPPPSHGNEDTRVGNFIRLMARCGQPDTLVYLGTTGVYGDCQGDWVDEQRAVAPVADRAHRRWDAEQRLLSWAQASGSRLVRLRVAGIYGDEKLPLERLRRGEPLLAPEHAPWTNRIHMHDLVRALIAAANVGRDGTVYNLSDGQPLRMTDYFLAIARHAGIKPPPLLSPEDAALTLSAGMQSYLAESRRIDNRRMREELGVIPDFPDLDSALSRIFPRSKH